MPNWNEEASINNNQGVCSFDYFRRMRKTNIFFNISDSHCDGEFKYNSNHCVIYTVCYILRSFNKNIHFYRATVAAKTTFAKILIVFTVIGVITITVVTSAVVLTQSNTTTNLGGIVLSTREVYIEQFFMYG